MGILVTGHLGFLGQHICRSLSDVGVPWYGLDRRQNDSNGQICGDVRDICDITIDSNMITEIIHLAGPVGVRTTSWRDEVICDEITAGAAALAAFAQRVDARVIFTSSSEIYGEASTAIRSATEPNPRSGYARGKLAAEKVFSSHPNTVVVRPFNVYGPGQRSEFIVPTIIDYVLADQPVPLVNNGQAIRQFTYVGDFVEAITRLRNGWDNLIGRTLNVAGPEVIGIRELALTIGQLLERRVRFVSMTPSELGRNPATEIRFRTVESSSIDGWQPRTGLADGLALTIAARLEDAARRGGSAASQASPVRSQAIPATSRSTT